MIYLIVKPGYGDHDGMPIAAFTKRQHAINECRKLNSAWDDEELRYFRRLHGGYPYRVKPFPIDKTT